MEVNAEDEAIESSVGDEKVAATAEDEMRDFAVVSPGCGFDDVIFRIGLEEPASGAADGEGGEWSQKLMFFEPGCEGH